MPAEDSPVQFTHADARKLADIHVALIGNEAMGTRGLVHRVVAVEEKMEGVQAKVETHDRKFWLAAVVGSGLWATLVAFKESIFGHAK